jgi:hypothetical protein
VELVGNFREFGFPNCRSILVVASLRDLREKFQKIKNIEAYKKSAVRARTTMPKAETSEAECGKTISIILTNNNLGNCWKRCPTAWQGASRLNRKPVAE